MKDQIIEWIKIKGIGYNEIVTPIKIGSQVEFDSIEWVKSSNQIILHKFVEDFDYEFDWEAIPNTWQVIIYHQLITPTMN